MKRNSVKCALIVLVVGSLFSCASFLESSAQARAIEPGSSLSIVFKGSRNAVFQEHLSAAFVRKGIVLKVIEPYVLLGSDLDQVLRPYGEYSVMTELASTLSRSSSGQITGDSELISRIVESNDIVESTKRINDLRDFYAALGENAGVDYIVLVEQRAGFNEMSITVVDLRSREIVMSYFLEADAQGIDNNIKPYEGPGLVDKTGEIPTATDTQSTRRSIDVAEYIATRITG